jgi:hypothetical protein
MEGEALVRRQPQPGVAAGQFGHRDLRLQLAEVRAQAVVQALAEGQVAFGVGPAQVDYIRLAEGRGVPARGCQPQEQASPFGQV